MFFIIIDKLILLNYTKYKNRMIGKIIRQLIYRDEEIWRGIKRMFVYPYFRFEHYRLKSIRNKMW